LILSKDSLLLAAPRKLVSTEIHLNLRSYYRKDVAAAGDQAGDKAEVDAVNLIVRPAELQPVRNQLII
jgi:hypothetical protein